MRAFSVLVLTVLSPALCSGSPGYAEPGGSPPPSLTHTCLITERFSQLVLFYQQVLGTTPRVSQGVYAEFPNGAGVLAIFSAAAQERYIPGSTRAGSNRSAILEFKVTDVDAEYTRLHNLIKVWVKPPTDQPWGTRSFYFRDPDGNLIDFYAPRKTP